MKVKQALAILNDMPPDAEVVMSDRLPIVAITTDGEFVYLSDWDGQEGATP